MNVPDDSVPGGGLIQPVDGLIQDQNQLVQLFFSYDDMMVLS